MDPLIFYWVLTLVVLMIVTLMADIGTASLVTAFIMVIKFIMQPYRCKKKVMSIPIISGFDNASSEEPKAMEPGKLPALGPKIFEENSKMLDDVLEPKKYSADDKIFNASVVSGYKNKKAMEIRSHWNSSNNQWKKYYDAELGQHQSRVWWEDDDFELSKNHVVI